MEQKLDKLLIWVLAIMVLISYLICNHFIAMWLAIMCIIVY